MASHGGMRESSVRPAGPGNKAASELKLNLSELARQYTNDALDTLMDVMPSSQSDSAKVAATILDRAYGRPIQTGSLGLTPPFFFIKHRQWLTQV